MGFYDTSIVVAGVVLALFLGIIAYMMHTSTNTLAYPPVIAECPDYWKKGVNEDGEEVCENVLGVGFPENIGDVDCTSFTTDKFSVFTNALERMQQQKSYAETCNIAWDGITNNVKVITE